MKNKILFSIILAIICFSVVSCSTMSESQIIDSANKCAIERGLNLKNYEVSVNAPGEVHANMPMKIKQITNAAAVTYTPMVRGEQGYTFYIDRNSGKLVLVMKRK